MGKSNEIDGFSLPSPYYSVLLQPLFLMIGRSLLVGPSGPPVQADDPGFRGCNSARLETAREAPFLRATIYGSDEIYWEILSLMIEIDLVKGICLG